ncbi:hypothetical protein ABES80_07550 [Bacillus gobiensis]|uniref:hypothetical protein n=1 Tax=Bacillus gobiensis TaxID=1441095 RepID=UPI003D1B45CC
MKLKKDVTATLLTSVLGISSLGVGGIKAFATDTSDLDPNSIEYQQELNQELKITEEAASQSVSLEERYLLIRLLENILQFKS